MDVVKQLILKQDSHYSLYRLNDDPQLRMLYLRRRQHLLNCAPKTDTRKQYWQTRESILRSRYGNTSSTSLAYLRPSHKISSSSTVVDHPNEKKQDAQYQTTKSKPVPVIKPQCTIAPSPTIQVDVHHVFIHHQKSITNVKFAHNDASKLACSSLDGIISVLRIDQSAVSLLHSLTRHKDGVTCFEWSISNDLIVSTSLDGTCCVWNAYEGTCSRTISPMKPSPLLSCVFQPLNNNLVVIGNKAGWIQALNISTGRLLSQGKYKGNSPVTALCFQNTGKILWSGDKHGTVTSFQFDSVTGKMIKCKKVIVKENRVVTSLMSRYWSGSSIPNPVLLVSCANNALYVYKIKDSNGSIVPHRSFPIKHKSQSIRSTFCSMIGHQSWVVTGSEDCNIYILNVDSSTDPVVKQIRGHPDAVLDVSFNFDETKVASGDAIGTVIIWNFMQK